jgi:hypothetical protein
VQQIVLNTNRQKKSMQERELHQGLNHHGEQRRKALTIFVKPVIELTADKLLTDLSVAFTKQKCSYVHFHDIFAVDSDDSNATWYPPKSIG